MYRYVVIRRGRSGASWYVQSAVSVSPGAFVPREVTDVVDSDEPVIDRIVSFERRTRRVGGAPSGLGGWGRAHDRA
ncbi:hypothetical protein [Tsukamurella sp. NPDC003166]|uniref:hypothetical protein n=1 Tax=Tsukamurella sp. NPDC003166 TaxID=3154444 RepID=UPI0033B1658E